MKVVILAGGLGTRISEESHLKPKPMIAIGDQPILWHIMKYYSCFGFQDFVICCGYKGYIIKEYFADYYLHRSDVTFDFSAENRMTVHSNVAEPWRVTLVDTGLNTQTGARIKRVQKYIGMENKPPRLNKLGGTEWARSKARVKGEILKMADELIRLYGDGVSNVDLNALLAQHRHSGKTVTLTGVQPGGRFGVLDIADASNTVVGFREKAKEDGGWINGGFMVAQPELFDYLNAEESCVLERAPLETLAIKGKLGIYKHYDFWQCMDTQRDKTLLEERWRRMMAPWKRWND